MKKRHDDRRQGVLSSAYGSISDVLVVHPGIATRASEQEYQEILSIFDKVGTIHQFAVDLPNYDINAPSYRKSKSGKHDRKINRIVSDVDFAGLLRSWSDEISMVQSQGFLRFRRWAQDPFVVLEREDAVVFLMSLKMQRACDFFMPLELSSKLNGEVLIKPIPYYLEGGNILKGSQRLYLGKDLLLQNPGLSEDEFSKQIIHDTGESEVLWIGLDSTRYRLSGSHCFESKSFQPLFHIDMFMTIGGEVFENERSIEKIFFASVGLTRHILKEQLASMADLGSELDEKCEQFFADLENSLNAKADLQLIKLPIYKHDNVFYSWNNCLVEISPKSQKMFLPNYIDKAGKDEEQLNSVFEALQNEVQGIFESEGFECIWIGPGRLFRTLSQQGGSLHCITKVLRREI